MKGINGKVAIVVGAAQGIGKATAQRLLEEGAAVVVADILEERLKSTVAGFVQRGLKAEPYVVDLRHIEEIDTMVEYAVKTYGRLDILINDAGVQLRGWATEYEEADWDHLMDVDLKSYFFASRAAARVMKKQGGGAIVCLSSANSERFTSKRAPYCIAKAGVNGLVAALGNELGRFGIRVNGVAPGYVMTELTLSAVKGGLLSEEIALSVTPLKRLLLPEEIASAVCFLASDEASGINGQMLFVDGGWSKNGLPEPKDME